MSQHPAVSGDSELLTVPEVAAYLSINRCTVYELMNAGHLESVKIGRARRIPRDAVATFIANLREVS